MAAVAELDAALQALRSLKPPGVTKSKIASITQLCVDNVKNESVLVQKIYTQFKRTPATHKLGVLYVVDSVTRQWIEKATASGESLGGSSNADGTFAAGVQRMTDLLPLLVKDVISTAPEDQKDKITKLVDIWDRGNIFPAPMIKDFKAKLEARPAPPAKTTTPPGNPPANVLSPPTQAPQNAAPSASEILRGLAGVTPQQPQFPMPVPSSNPTPPAPFAMPTFPPAQQQQPAFQMPQLQQQAPQPQAPDANPAMAAFRALETMLPPGAAQDPAQLQHWISILQELQTRGVPPDQWPEVIRIMSEQQKPAQQALPQQQQQQQYQAPARDRSRSPGRRRGSPDYQGYGGGASAAGAYRQRSPPRNASPSTNAPGSDRPRMIEFDPSLPKGSIKVYSRTLFIGGTTCGEAELRRIFSRFGEVQTCIAHPERRHAFIKMKTRAESQLARDGMDNAHDPEITGRVRSTRWGVGFGPRDCSDYTTGISIIPIERLTEADRKWTLTAEYGGTGGRAIESNMVIEEPDIEIGAGVSSKAISQRPGQISKEQQHQKRDGERRSDRRGGSGRNRSDVNNIPIGTQHSPQPQQQQQQQQQQPAFSMPQVPAFPTAPVNYDSSAFSGMPAVPGFGYNYMNNAPGT